MLKSKSAAHFSGKMLCPITDSYKPVALLRFESDGLIVCLIPETAYVNSRHKLAKRKGKPFLDEILVYRATGTVLNFCHLTHSFSPTDLAFVGRVEISDELKSLIEKVLVVKNEKEGWKCSKEAADLFR